MGVWKGKLDALLVGGGVISLEAILPTLFQERRKGRIGKISVSARRTKTTGAVRETFPDEEMTLYPDPQTSVDANTLHPESFAQALARLGDYGVVIVATPDSAHTPIILTSLDQGHHVIVEKPLCLKVSEARQIEERARKKALYVYTDYHKRHDLAIRAVKYCYARGEMGQMLHGHAWIEEKREMALETFAGCAHESSPFEYIGVHYADAYYFITGLRPKRLVAFAQKKSLPGLGIDTYDAVQAVIEWEDGSVFWIQTSWILPPSNTALTNQGMQLTGTRGEYKADHKDRHAHFNTDSGGYEHYNPYFFKPYNSWSKPEVAEWSGYGYDSIVQGFDDIRDIFRATEGLSDEQAFEKRQEKIAEFDKVRPLPRQSRVGTAIIEAARYSFEHASSYVSFDSEMNLHPEGS